LDRQWLLSLSWQALSFWYILSEAESGESVWHLYRIFRICMKNWKRDFARSEIIWM
jgi:Predicted permease